MRCGLIFPIPLQDASEGRNPGLSPRREKFEVGGSRVPTGGGVCFSRRALVSGSRGRPINLAVIEALYFAGPNSRTSE